MGEVEDMNENETEMGREQKKSLTKTREAEREWLQIFKWLLKKSKNSSSHLKTSR